MGEPTVLAVLGKGLWDRVTAERKVCQRAIERAEREDAIFEVFRISHVPEEPAHHAFPSAGVGGPAPPQGLDPF